MSSIPAVWDFDITRADSSVKYFEPVLENGDPIDLTVFEDIRMEIRQGNSASTKLVALLTLGNGISIVGSANNGVLIDLSSQLTSLLNFRIAYHALRFVYAGDTAVETWAVGRIKTTFIPSDFTV